MDAKATVQPPGSGRFGTNVVTRDVVRKDFPELHDVAKAFIHEAGLGLTYDGPNCQLAFEELVEAGNCRFRVAVDLDRECIAGVYIFKHEAPFFVEKFGYLSIFYVCPEYRITSRNAARTPFPVANRLAQDVVAASIESECRYVFISSTAMISAKVDIGFTRLFESFRFEEMGPILFRRNDV